MRKINVLHVNKYASASCCVKPINKCFETFFKYFTYYFREIFKYFIFLEMLKRFICIKTYDKYAYRLPIVYR